MGRSSASACPGLFGGIGLERYRYARKDLEHRQGYYHRLLAAFDDYTSAASDLGRAEATGATVADFEEGPYPDTDTMERLRAAIERERQGIEVFGARGVSTAARDFERVLNKFGAVEPARERLVNAMRRDVGPRRFGIGPRG